MIAGDHDHAYAGASAFGQRGGNLGAQRIGEADESDELERVGAGVVRERTRACALRHTQHTQALLCILRDAREQSALRLPRKAA